MPDASNAVNREAMKLEAVKSSRIKELGYDPGSKTMHVRFHGGGKLYAYSNVEQAHYDAFRGAESLGAHFHENFRDAERFPFKLVTE